MYFTKFGYVFYLNFVKWYMAERDGAAASALPAPSPDSGAKSGRSIEGGRGGCKKYLPILNVSFVIFFELIFLVSCFYLFTINYGVLKLHSYLHYLRVFTDVRLSMFGWHEMQSIYHLKLCSLGPSGAFFLSRTKLATAAEEAVTASINPTAMD